MRRPLRRLLRRLLLSVAWLVPAGAPWERIALRVPVTAFGPGSRRQFTHYFEGESRVRMGSIDEIAEWLLACEYATDTDLFNQRDVWQHPSAFEGRRRGDCEDFALWAWRKLAEIGIEAEFYVGRVLWSDDPRVDRQHAWVVYRINGTAFLFEPAARSRQEMIRLLADVIDEYVPHFAVNRHLRTSAFGGVILDSRRLRFFPRRRTVEEHPATSAS